MSRIVTLTDHDYAEVLRPLWSYLGGFDAPEPSDVIFVFGGLDLAVPRRAAELYTQGIAPVALISGAAGPLTRKVFSSTEAETFRDEMVKHGTPRNVIVLETRATNTLENVRFGMAALAEQKISVQCAALVGKTFLMRRCRATFAKQYPDVRVSCCPPSISVLEAVDRDRGEFAARLLAELRRLDDYGAKGDIAPQPRDTAVDRAADDLRALLSDDS
ncbi:MAG: YdcF family protein [Thermoanaerobaculia bacterium]